MSDAYRREAEYALENTPFRCYNDTEEIIKKYS